MNSLKTQLFLNGYCIVDNVLDLAEIEFARGLFFDWYAANQISHRTVPPHGIIKHWEIGHTAFAWWLRTRPKVQAPFATIWGTDDLIVSYDGACYMPKQATPRRNNSWLHLDQAAKDLDFKCVQGFVALTTNEEATLGLVPQSHWDFENNVKSVKSKSKRWLPLPSDDRVIRVQLLAGQMVLWDSRVAHMNFYGPEERLVQYVSYLPRNVATQKDLEKRLLYRENRRTTSHWAAPVEVVGKQPQVYNDLSKLIDYSVLQDPTDPALWVEMEEEINKLV
jgi:hypothetical protein